VNKDLFLTHNNTNYINKIKNEGFVLAAYTCNDYDENVKLQDVGFDSITTDFPNLHIDFRIKKGLVYDVNKLNNLGNNGRRAVISGIGTNGATLGYLYNDMWLSASDNSIIQSWSLSRTVLNFNTGQSSNSDLSTTYGSASTQTGGGIITTGNGTPDIDLLWAPSPDVLEVHAGSGFNTPFLGLTPVLQLDLNILSGSIPDKPTVTFTTTTLTAKVKIESFRIGHATDMVETPHSWTIRIFEGDITGMEVFTYSTGILGIGDGEDVTMDFEGSAGENYVLQFDNNGNNHYRGAINNLTFQQLY
jgi:hypothetical protein